VGEINHVGDNFFDVKPYPRGGIFSVRLTDSNYPGNLGAYFIKRMYLLMTILNVNPSVNAGLDQHAFEGEVVQFSGSFTDPNIIDTHTIEWDFGDGTGRSNTLTPSHLYHDDGVYTVLLTVTDSEGGVGTDTLIVTVSNIIPIVSAMEDQNTQEGSENSLILATFTDQGEFDSHSALIDWGDGTIEPGIVIEPIDNEYWEGIGTVNGTHTYKDNGIYVVTIIVSDDDGDTNSDSLLFTVDNIAPIVGAGSDLNVDEGEVISFSGTFHDPGSLDTHTIEWNFGDGNIAMGTLTPAYIYEDNGVFTATLTVTDDDGGTDSDSLTIVVNNIAPMVYAGEDQIVDEGEEVTFNGIVTDLGGLDTHTIEWDLGDGTIIIGTLSPTHTYADNGMYSVILTATDDDGAFGSDIAVITVNNVAPIVDAGSDQTVDEGDIVSFSGSFIDPGDFDTHTIEWDFGGGTKISGTLNPSHTYGDNGVYVVTLTVTDNDGGTATDSLTITVNNVAPAVSIGDDQTVNEGDLVSFSGSFTDPGIFDTHTFEWDFGDGTIAWGTLNIDHVYEDNGKYAVTLTITDDDGDSDTDTILLIVNNVAPIADAGSDLTVTEGDIISFGGNFVDPGALDTHIIKWNLGDGTIISDTLYPTHVYEDNGVFTVMLTVTDDDGDTSSDTLIVIVNNAAPVVTIGEDITIDEGDEVSFSGSFSDPGVLDTHTIAWEFGDGTSTTGTLSVSHIYEDDGVYIVILTITDNDGDIGTDSLLVTVNNIAPAVTIGYDQTVNEGDEVSFSGTFSDPGVLDTHTIEWDFGDGAIITDIMDPTYIYADNGKYPVTLMVADDDGGVDIDTLIVTVNNVAPSVVIENIETIFALDSVNATGNASDPGADDLTFIWSWGDASDDNITLYLNSPLTFPVEIVEIISHIYDFAGEFLITLTVIDDDGGIGTDSRLVEISNPRELKLKTIIDLENLKTGDKCIDKKIDHVIKFIEKSLCEYFWENSTHLDSGKGALVFIFEMIAVRYFQKFIMDETNEFIVQNLVKADELLAENAIVLAENTDVINPKFQWKYDCYLSKAQNYFNEGKEDSLNEDYLCAMYHFLKAWRYAHSAIRWATKEETHHCGCHGK
jgi:PKD repeat protein